MNTENLKTGGIQASEVLGGFIAANVASKLVPEIGHPVVPKALPILIGLGGLFLNNEHVTNVSTGMIAHGVINTANHFLRPTQDDGMNGIADNPTVAKIIDLALPSLGNADDVVYPIDFENDFENEIEDAGYTEVSTIGNAMMDSPEMDIIG